MIVSRTRERNKNGGLACGRDFRDRAGSGAAQNQVSAGKKCGHIVDELVDLSRNRCSGVSGLHLIIVTVTGLMDYVQSGQTPHQFWHCVNYRLVNGVGPLAS